MSKERTFTVRSFCTGKGRAGNGSDPVWITPQYSLEVDENTPLSTPEDLVTEHDEHCPGPVHLILIDVGNGSK